MIRGTTQVFRARASAFQGAQDVLLVAHRDDGSSLIALANAYNGGFSTCFPDGSRWFLERLRSGFADGASPEAAVEGALTGFFDAFPTDPDDEWTDAAVSFVAVWVAPGSVRIAGLGGEVVRLWRAGENVFEFPPRAHRVRSLPPPHLVLARIAERTRKSPIGWANLEPVDEDRIDILSWRLDEALRGGEAPESDSDPQVLAALKEAPFVASVRVDIASVQRSGFEP